MKAYIAVVNWTDTGKIAKYKDYATRKEARTHIDAVHDRYPNAFVAPRPDGRFDLCRVNQSDKTLITVPPPPPPPPPSTNTDILRRAIADKGGPDITDADMDTARETLEAGR